MITRYIPALAFILFVTACTEAPEKKESKATEMAVSISNEIGFNENVARDIASLDFNSVVSQKLNITDLSILKDIVVKSAKDSISGQAKLVLNIGKNAELYRAQIEKLFAEFSTKKVADYSAKKNDLQAAENAASYYLYLIEHFGVDSIWPQISPNFEKFATKEQLAESFQKRKELFMPLGKRSIVNRRLADSIVSGLKGNFCTISYEYQNYDHEEITLEKVDDRYRFLGYNFIYVPKK